MTGAAPSRAARLREARALLERVARSGTGGTRSARALVSEGASAGAVPPAGVGVLAGAGVSAGAGLLPVAAPLRPLLPGGGLRRGSTVAVSAPGYLLLTLLAEASAQGSWCAVVGLPELGVVAAAEAGLVLSRTALVPRPGAELVGVASALLDGIDMVVLAGAGRLPAGARQRLAARARHRGAVLLAVGRWPGADLDIGVTGGHWHGLVGGGAGRLRYRRARVRVGGRGAAYRGRSAELLLPGPQGVAGHEGAGHESTGRRRVAAVAEVTSA